MKKFLKITFFLILAAAIAFFAWIYLVPNPERSVFEFVPQDAIFMVQSSDPIDDWKEFSASEVWKFLKQNKEMAETNEQANYLDSLISDNKALLSLVGERQVIISAHMTRRNDYDFLYLIDLKKGAKVTFFVDVLLGAFDDKTLKTEKVSKDGFEITKIYDDDGEAILLAFVDNILVCSYSDKILLDALNQSITPWYSQNEAFMEIKNKSAEKGPYQIYMNFTNLPDYINLYMEEPSETVNDLAKILRFASFDLSVSDHHLGLEGYTDLKDSVPHLLRGLLEVEDDRLRSQEILPANTSFFMSFDFDQFYTKKGGVQEVKRKRKKGKEQEVEKVDTVVYGGFYGKILESLARDEAEFDDLMKNQSRVENFLDISMEENFFSWIGNEISLGMVPTNKFGSQQAFLAIFHANSIDKARENLDFVTKRIKKKTPVKFKQEDYKGHEVNYLEMKGFFRLFFGKLFNKFEKPHFIYLDDFVVFSNDTVSLHRMIDQFEAGETLQKSSEFKEFHNEFNGQSNLFLYMSLPNMFPYVVRMGEHETRQTVDENRQYFTAFRMVGIQLSKKSSMYESRVYASFQPEEAPLP
ncbi:MAG: DUF3352 domain-containing protein [Bacteroidia bacterium]|nr:DUF3352 domain-containing protein [Bacteroidia bacterium]